MIFLLLSLFQIKHWLCDFPFQTPFMLQKFKDKGWILPLSAHAGTHALGTFLVLNLIPARIPFEWTLIFSLFDFVVHFIVDRIKASPKLLGRYQVLSKNDFINISKGFSPFCVDSTIQVMEYDGSGYACDIPVKYMQAKCFEISDADKKRVLDSNKYFWWSLGADQFLHHHTHYFIIFSVISIIE